MTQEMDQVRIARNLRVGKHEFRLEVHASKKFIGAWFSRPGEPDTRMMCIYADGNATSLMIYPPKDYLKAKATRLPISIGTDGVQFPHPDGSITHLTLSDLSQVIKALGVGRTSSLVASSSDNVV
jgi:hypothetical protein